MADKIGSRCEYGGHFGTVRYFGEIKDVSGMTMLLVDISLQRGSPSFSNPWVALRCHSSAREEILRGQISQK